VCALACLLIMIVGTCSNIIGMRLYLCGTKSVLIVVAVYASLPTLCSAGHTRGSALTLQSVNILSGQYVYIQDLLDLAECTEHDCL
jgi:hypothetical protein